MSTRVMDLDDKETLAHQEWLRTSYADFVDSNDKEIQLDF